MNPVGLRFRLSEVALMNMDHNVVSFSASHKRTSSTAPQGSGKSCVNREAQWRSGLNNSRTSSYYRHNGRRWSKPLPLRNLVKEWRGIPRSTEGAVQNVSAVAKPVVNRQLACRVSRGPIVAFTPNHPNHPQPPLPLLRLQHSPLTILTTTSSIQIRPHGAHS